jgi:hypothetical protein
MTLTDFAGLPDASRLYIFGSSRPLTADETARFLAAADEFLASWQAHKADVAAAREWRHDRFLLVAADESVTGLSGCSIDSLVNRIKAFEGEMAVRFLDGGAVFHRKGSDIVRTGRAEFIRLIESGEVGKGTIVFDNTITTLGQLRAGSWELPFERSWHAGLAPLPSTVPTQG